MNAVRFRFLAALAAATLIQSCGDPEPLTAERAGRIVGSHTFRREPVYAEVPQKVWWDASAPKDAYDELALRTLRNLERAGLVTLEHRRSTGGESWMARATKQGFPILGTAPSARGPVFRGRICEKRYDGLRSFVRHPTDPGVGHAELVWHYENPTPLYPLFETKIDKPLGRPFVSHVSLWHEKGQWRFEVNVKKAAVNDASTSGPTPRR